MRVTFLGATETVTGSKYLLESAGSRILIDCGLFQGKKELRRRNWDPIPVNPADINSVLLTHAHLDHCGYIPRLVSGGFDGTVYCSPATLDLCKIILPDSGHIQEEDAAQANRHGYSRHAPALPLYTEKEARASLSRFQTVDFGKAYALDNDLSFTLSRAGHILGASFIKVRNSAGTSILFSGDLGRLNDPVMKAPAQIQAADYLVLESTYGNRLHEKSDPSDDLELIIRRTAARGGTVIIPAFAVGRAQSLMYYMHKLKAEKRIPSALPVYLDSPMSIDASELLIKHLNDHRLRESLCRDVCAIAQYTQSVEDSKRLDRDSSHIPKVIISASGMATGGRVLHHLKYYIGDQRNTILLAGFQAAGTRGDRLVRGEKEIKIHGRMWPVKAEVIKLDNMSAHADYGEILTWLGHFTSPPRKVFIVHGEKEAAFSLKGKIEEKFGLNVVVPEYRQQEEL